jgi:hypothetical protein
LVTFSVPVIRQVPGKCALFQDVQESGFVREEESQIGGQDAVLDVAEDLGPI